MIIHFVDVIAGQNNQVLGAFFFDCINILINRVGSSLVPVFVDSLLRRNDIDKLIELTAKEVTPAKIDMPV